MAHHPDPAEACQRVLLASLRAADLVDAGAFGGCFTADAVWFGDPVRHGRAEISSVVSPRQPGRFVRHLFAAARFSSIEGGIAADWHALLISAEHGPDGAVVRHVRVVDFADELIDDDGWRIRSRRSTTVPLIPSGGSSSGSPIMSG